MIKEVTKKLARNIDYHETLIERLKDHDYAVGYLNVALEESLNGDKESQKLFLRALRNVAEGQRSKKNNVR
jgi:predicted fused transcriptional regulator/phosphomethylpyrimidine kinase